jgi:hypothetical protein
MTVSLLAELEAKIRGMNPDDRAQLERLAASELARPFLPNPGPQTMAHASKADILLYGGAAGGGKSFLMLGAAASDHSRALILRRQTVELDGLIADSKTMLRGRGTYNGQDLEWTLDGDKSIKFGGCKEPDDWAKYAGRARDFIGFDEAADFLEVQVQSLIGWLRSTKDGQRCRVILATNPPRSSDGLWLIKWFAPWLDPMHNKPAAPGELRWRILVRGEFIWTDGPEPVEIDGETYTPQSLTFVPALLADNPYLTTTGYRERVQNLPEPLRSQLLHGDFLAGREDADNQVIPSEWVEAAQARWRKPVGKRMMVIACDVAQGGPDKSTVATLHEGWVFDELRAKPGAETQDGPSIVSMIMTARRDEAVIGIDCTGGWGGSARDHLRTHNKIEAVGVVSSQGSDKRDPHSGYEYRNLRSEMWWEFRRALDPTSDDPVSLPPGSTLKAQLCAPTWRDQGGKILIESKDDIRKRLGSSTDEADAVIMAWNLRSRALSAYAAANKRYPTTYLKPSGAAKRYQTSYKR